VVDVAELERQVEYKFAPEPLIAVQALANTYALETDEERLADPSSARDWLVESDLATAAVRVGGGELQRLLDLRGVVRDLIDANLAPEPDRQAAAVLAELAAAHPLPLTAGSDGELRLDLTPAASVDDFVAQVVGIVFQAQLAGSWPRLKICALDECRWAFYDSSRNRGGTWCQMEICGNRAKNRAYRQRRARA
jgi:predicted RNA-binding Zn ribbon-like protein